MNHVMSFVVQSMYIMYAHDRSGRNIKYDNILYNLVAIVIGNDLLYDISAGLRTQQIFDS